MKKNTETLAILFADIAKSTQLYETLGDKDAKQLIDSCIAYLTKVTVDHHGTVVKTIGDEIMCTFPLAQDAINASVAMHEAIDGLPVVVKGLSSGPRSAISRRRWTWSGSGLRARGRRRPKRTTCLKTGYSSSGKRKMRTPLNQVARYRAIRE